MKHRGNFRGVLESFGKRWSGRRSAAAVRPPRAPRAADPRAKNQRHGKVTADRWNQ
jgi:hypothetical protein